MELRSLVLILVLFYILGQYRPADAITDPQDVAVLRALQQAWGSSKLRWSGDPCGSGGLGVSCDTATNSRVESLILSGMNLVGELPDDIGDFLHLKTLDLSFNTNLTGRLPPRLGNLGSLTTLILQSCGFSGHIPSELGNLKNLTFLALNGNFLIGSIPNEIGLLTQLYWLDVAFNNLSGPLPVSTDGNKLNAGLDNLTNAKHFHLNSNSFIGQIPREICNAKMSLIHLLLDFNQLSGKVPDEVGLLVHLEILKLNNNHLSGAVPANISQLEATLNDLHLNRNAFIGSLPDLKNLRKLQILDLSYNSFKVSSVPSWLSNLTSLTSLEMVSDNLHGPISADVFSLPELQVIKLDDNFIDGTLSLTNASQQLQLVSMEHNNISNVNFGGFKITLLLQGNKACDNSYLSVKICSVPAPSVPYPNENGCSSQCASGLVSNPTICFCAEPYRGYLLFRAPQFPYVNPTQIKSLGPALASGLNMSDFQVVITNATPDSTFLKIDVSFFPNNVVHWRQEDIQRISSVLGNAEKIGRKIPPAYGPPLFVPYPYEYAVSRKGAGLSSGSKIGIAVGVGTLVLVILALCMYAVFQKRRADKALESSRPFASWGSSGGESGGAPKLKGARRFSFAELKKATENFNERNAVGTGGYGKVYKGVLLTGEQVAIKRAQKGSMQGATEFKNEIELLSRVHHKNLVNLIGFCFEQREQMLVYEYMAKGALRDNLLGRTGVKLDWQKRLMIALGSAKGISYLHELVDPPIIHRDIKSSNILLDEKSIAKVADFGLSKIGPEAGSGKSHVSTQVKGTVGYLDPEYYTTQQLTEKSDVYSFGVVLLELMTAKQPIERGKYIVREVRTALDKGGMTALHPLLDPNLKDYSLEEFTKFLDLALHCVDETGVNRPTMNEVAKELESLIGHAYPNSGSVSKDTEKLSNDIYGAPDSELTHKKDTDSSYHNRSLQVPD